MSTSHLDVPRVHDYFAAALDPAEERAVEEHVFGCDDCARLFDAAGGLSAGLRSLIPPVVSRSWLEREIGRGTAIRVTEVAAGEHITADFSHEIAFLVFVLKGDLAAAQRIDVEVISADRVPLMVIEEVPFDPARGEVIVACQRHYIDEFPRDLGFRLVTAGAGERSVIGEYRVLHVVPPSRS